MPITYKVVSCINPAGAEGTDYACDVETKTGDYGLDQMVEDISYSTTVTEAEVRGILEAFFRVITRHVNDGDPVRFDQLGTVRPAIKSRCFPQSAIAAEDFNPASYIEGAHLRFRPVPQFLKHIREYATLKRVPSDLMA